MKVNKNVFELCLKSETNGKCLVRANLILNRDTGIFSAQHCLIARVLLQLLSNNNWLFVLMNIIRACILYGRRGLGLSSNSLTLLPVALCHDD